MFDENHVDLIEYVDGVMEKLRSYREMIGESDSDRKIMSNGVAREILLNIILDFEEEGNE